MKPIDKWRKDNGNTSLRLNYPLNEDSIVFDVGGYKGQWAQAIYNKYKCTIYIFEPVKHLYDIIVAKFKGNEKIKVFQFALSDRNGEVDISLKKDASSYVTNIKKVRKSERIELKNASEFIIKNEIRNVDLIKLNIEGAEYEVLTNLFESDHIKIFDNIQVQFHWAGIENHDAKLDLAYKQLSETHTAKWSYKFVWDSWKRND